MPRRRDPEKQVRAHHTNKSFLITEQQRLITEFGNRREESPVKLCTFMDNSLPINFHAEDRVSIEDLITSPEMILVGKVFVCRTITPCVKVLSLLTVVEVPDPDLKDKAVFFSLYNYQHSLDEKQERSIPHFPAGTILAVENPTFFQSSAYQVYTLRCDNPADVFVLSEKQCQHLFPSLNWPSSKSMSEDLPLETESPEMKDWKLVGHYWMDRKNYIAALQAYSAAVEQDNEDTDALSLRCSMFSQLELYEKSLVDATAILHRNPSDEEAICRKASALIYQSKYTTAMEFLNHQINQNAPSIDHEQNVRLKKLLNKAETWSNQNKNGDYDLVKMLNCGAGYTHDCANYIGNVVEQNVQGKGRGMVANDNIKCGDLIIGVKAFRVVSHSGIGAPRSWFLQTETQIKRSGAFTRMLMYIAQRMIRDQEFAKDIYSLCGGTQNVSDCSSSDNSAACKYINLRKINTILSLNGFSDSVRLANSHTRGDVIGIWPVASLFNHGCYDSNSTWKICGNLMFVRATRDIVKGEEVTFLYSPYTVEYSDRVKALSQYNFVCQCKLCLLDSRESIEIRNRRKEILYKLNCLVSENPFRHAQYEELITELQGLRLDYPDLNVCIIEPMLSLAKMHMFENQYSIAAKMLLNVLKMTLKTVLTEDSFALCVEAITCLMHCNDVNNARICARALKDTLIQEFGMCSNKLLDYIKPNLKDTMILLGIVST